MAVSFVRHFGQYYRCKLLRFITPHLEILNYNPIDLCIKIQLKGLGEWNGSTTHKHIHHALSAEEDTHWVEVADSG